ncbi:MAG: hypothetical protein OXB84_05040, partial [Halobacteriovoraceae bacterium]|nr:hypothetical protein [Halobacteriovoraceae bacterium]
DLLKLEKVKDTLATKLYNAIQKSKNVELATFISALGISGGGYNKSEKIIRAGFNTVEKLKSMTMEDLNKVESFAEKSSGIFIKSLKKKIPLIDKLLDSGFKFEIKSAQSASLTNKSICITGSLDEKRSVIEKKIRIAGGKIVGSISKNTDYLLTNDKNSNSNKFQKAKELNITVIDEVQLKKILS